MIKRNIINVTRDYDEMISALEKGQEKSIENINELISDMRNRIN